jgi:hypothetical protein
MTALLESAVCPDDPIPNPSNSRQSSKELFIHPQIKTTRRVPHVRCVNLGLAFAGVGFEARGQRGSFPHPEQLPTSLLRSVRLIAVQPPISTIHCKCLYSLANAVLALPMFSSPNNSPTHSCPCALRSHGCHPRQRAGSAFLPSFRLAPFLSFTPSPGRSLVCTEPRRATNPFVIRTYGKCAPNPFRIRTSKTQDLKSFIIRTYKKTGGGGSNSEWGKPILAVALPSPPGPDRAPQVPLPRSRQSARITTVAAIAARRETSPLPAVSNAVRADIGFGIRRLPFPVASRSRQDRDRTRKKAWVHRSKM